MLGSYLRAAFRALVRDRFHAALNIIGLAVSLGAALLIAAYVRHELSYERFIAGADRVHRVEIVYANKGQQAIHLAQSPGLTAETLRTEFPQWLIATSLDVAEALVTVDGRTTRMPVAFGDEFLFDVIDLPVVSGNPRAALTQPGEALVSRTMALRLFGTAQAIGRSLRLGSSSELRVAGILEDLPQATHLRNIDLLVSRQTQEWPNARLANSWGIPVGATYIRLREGATAEEVARQLPGLVRRRAPQSANSSYSLTLRPLTEIHLSAGEGATISNHNQTMLQALMATAILLILIACFNYVNLASARGQLRMREAGIRRVLGSKTWQLVIQHQIETLVITLLAFVLAVAMARTALPVFGNLVGRQLSLSSLLTPASVSGIVTLLLIVSAAAGAYPAIRLACSSPAILTSSRVASGSGSFARSLMVGLQFGITVALIIAASVVHAQVSYLRNIDPGFDRQGLLIIRNMPTRADAPRGQAYLDAMRQSPYVLGAAAALAAPDPAYEGNMFFRRPGAPESALLGLQDLQVSHGYFELLGIKPVAGRLFSPDFNDVVDLYGDPPSSRGSIVISESAVPLYRFGSPEQAIGQVLQAEWNRRWIDYTVIGVVPDIHLRLAQAPRKPADYMLVLDNLRTGLLRVAPGAYQQALAQARETWSRMFPATPFAYEFLDDLIDRTTADQTRLSALFAFFTALGILIACLGVFGLASYVTARRAREIAIRKVLGASTVRIAGLLIWDFAKPVVVASLIAWPVAGMLMSRWLAGFAYRIDLGPRYFLGASALALLVMLLVVMARALQAARARPVMALRTD